MEFVESGIYFNIPNELCFLPEESQFYVDNQDGIKIVDFVYLKYGTQGLTHLFISEVKSSSPRPPSAGGVENRFDDFLTDIIFKFTNTLNMILSLRSRRIEDRQVPSRLLNEYIADVNIVFMLIIRNHQRDWCDNLMRAIESKMRRTLVLNNRNLTKIIVLNENSHHIQNIITRQNA